MPTTIDHRSPTRPTPIGARRCSHQGCPTLLASFNPRETCYLHTPLRFPRNGRPKIVASSPALPQAHLIRF